MAVKTWRIADDQPIARMDRYIEKMLHELPQHAIREAFSHHDIKMNGVRVKPDTLLAPGAQVQVYYMAENTPELDIVYEDDNVLLINKRGGISSEGGADQGTTALMMACRYIEKQTTASRPPVLCHRLDNQTSGLLLFAKNEMAESALLAAFKSRTVHKSYHCLTLGTPKPAAGVVEAFLVKDAEAGRVRVVHKAAPNALPIKTGYQVIQPGAVALIKVDLYTGRTHQIRAQMASLGHPVLGDDAYGDRAGNKRFKARRLMLCATDMTFSQLTGGMAYLNEKHFHIDPPFQWKESYRRD